MRANNRRRGNSIVEFTLAGIPVIFMVWGTVQVSLAMWHYHTLAHTVNEAARYAAVRGQGCVSNGNTCSATVGMIAGQIQSTAIGIPADQLNVTLTTDSGQSLPCAPLNSCLSNTTVWPPATNSDNAPGKNVTISAHYVFSSGLTVLWPGAGKATIGVIALPARSTQQIVF